MTSQTRSYRGLPPRAVAGIATHRSSQSQRDPHPEWIRELERLEAAAHDLDNRSIALRIQCPDWVTKKPTVAPRSYRLRYVSGNSIPTILGRFGRNDRNELERIADRQREYIAHIDAHGHGERHAMTRETAERIIELCEDGLREIEVQEAAQAEYLSKAGITALEAEEDRVRQRISELDDLLANTEPETVEGFKVHIEHLRTLSQPTQL